MNTKLGRYLAILLFSTPCLAYDPEDMSPAETLAFRTYVSSVQLEAQVAECKAKLPTWKSDYPDALKGWLKQKRGLIDTGRKSFNKLVASAASEGPRKLSVDQALGEIRKEAVEEIASFSSDHFVEACIGIGQELRKQDQERSKAP